MASRAAVWMIGLLTVALPCAAQIPEAPGTSGVAPRDERPGDPRPPLPAGSAASQAPTPAGGEQGARDTIETLDRAKANARAEKMPAHPDRPRKRHRSQHRRSSPPPASPTPGTR